MKRAIQAVQILFALEGVLFILRSPQFVNLFGKIANISVFGLDLVIFWQAYAPNLRQGLPVLGFVALMLAWGLHQRKRWAWRCGIIYSLMNLGVFPFLLPLGVVSFAMLAWAKKAVLVEDTLARIEWQKESAQKRLPPGYTAVVLIVMVAVAAGAYMMVGYSQLLDYPAMPLWVIPIAIVAAVLASTITHELGHVVAAKLAGFELANLSLGPFWLCRDLAGWKWKFIPNLGWTGALASAYPKKQEKLATGVFLYLAGGPVATLLLGLASLTLFLSARDTRWAWCADGLGILALVALTEFLSEMSLVYKGHVFTDGARLVQLWQGGAERRRLLATFAIGLCETTPRRPSEWTEEWLKEATSDVSSPLYFAACYYSYISELDRGNWERAGTWLDELLGREVENPSPARRWKAALEGAYYEAVYRDDAVRARQWLSAPRDGVAVEPVTEWRAEAAVQLAEGNLEGCAERILKVRVRLAEVADTGWKSFETTLIDQLDRKLTGARTATADRQSTSDALKNLRDATGVKGYNNRKLTSIVA